MPRPWQRAEFSSDRGCAEFSLEVRLGAVQDVIGVMAVRPQPVQEVGDEVDGRRLRRQGTDPAVTRSAG
ncbi:hypothetical protein BIU87_12805 [Streptomyces sp. ZS0098]|nr:hypothetical protein BIU87_12805 [Streptomyces sp. ZS0098]